jgi:hypothetical protein
VPRPRGRVLLGGNGRVETASAPVPPGRPSHPSRRCGASSP